MAVFVDEWRLPPSLGEPHLGSRAKRRLLDALGLTRDLDTDPDLDAALDELQVITGTAAHLDPRLAYTLNHLSEAADLRSAAQKVGL
ncbi:hypothetical protein AB0J63_17860 [Streptosporangium canum]|uniref:hypothetical protein n=1 Tax=Streptosporangium canum TaxID=324952 RepID=UPI003444A584